MQDQYKSHAQLLAELAELRQRVTDLEARHQQAEEALRQCERDFKTLVENTPDMIARLDQECRHTYVNPAVEKELGISPQALLGKTHREMGMSPAVADLVEATIRRVFETRQEQAFETAMPTAAGLRHYWTRSVPELAEDGSVTSALFIHRDVTERKQAEEKIRENERFLQAVFDGIQDGISILDKDLNIVRVNHSMEQWYSHARPLPGKKCFVAYHGRSEPCEVCPTRQALETGVLQMSEIPQTRPDGMESWLELYAFPLFDIEGNLVRVIEHVRNITRRKQAEQELQAQRDFAQQVMNAMGQGLTVTDAEGRFEFVNPAYARMVGYTPEELIGKRPRDVTVTEDHATLAEAAVLRQRGKTSTYETRLRCADGSLMPVLITGVPRWPQDQLTGAIAVVTDLTERKRAERELRQRLDELAAINAISQATASQLELNALLEQVGRMLRRTFTAQGLYIALLDRQANLIRFPYWQFYDQQKTAEPLPVGQGITWMIIHSGQPLVINQDFERRSAELGALKITEALFGQAPKAGLAVPIQVKGESIGVICIQEFERENAFTEADVRFLTTIAANVGIAIQNAQLFMAVQRELAERKRAEAELRQANRELEARNEELDAFTHTVAHDIKNPVGLVTGFAQTLLHDYDVLSDEERKKSLQSIARNGRKIGNILDALLLLAWVRKTDVQLTPLDIGSIVAEAQQRLADLIEQNEATLAVPTTWPACLGYAPWVEEIWINYLSNAIKYGGHPSLVELGAETQPDGRICFWVRDNGDGITPEAQTRLFSPFTRLDQINAQGYGLGLSIVRRIVENWADRPAWKARACQARAARFSLRCRACDVMPCPFTAGFATREDSIAG